MNKTTAHIIIGVFDCAALYACFYVFSEWNRIETLIQNSANGIELQNRVGLFLLLTVIPLIHFTSFIQWGSRARVWLNRIYVAIFILLIATGVLFNIIIDQKIIRSGYQYCPLLSKSMTFSEFKIYTIDQPTCQK